MPFFVPESIEQDAICYFTILTLNRYSVKKSLPIYEKVSQANDWEYELKRVLGISDDELRAAKNVVNKGFSMLNEYDLVVRRGGPLYPKRLNEVDDSPLFLFLRGDALLTDNPVISIVGTRHPTPTGANNARRLSRLLSERHIVVASGLAKGIDYAAHAGTKDAGKPTIAVIGTGLNKAYPAEHRQIQEYIGATGLVISQFLPSAPVQKWNFPMRNATMSGISIATIVIEAGETSGALIQAREALKQGRRVFIPQSAVENPNLKWPKTFVYQKGAQSFTTIDDLMEKLQRENLLAAPSSNRESRSTTYTLDVSENATGMQ
jgi:DNA processing protein